MIEGYEWLHDVLLFGGLGLFYLSVWEVLAHLIIWWRGRRGQR